MPFIPPPPLPTYASTQERSLAIAVHERQPFQLRSSLPVYGTQSSLGSSELGNIDICERLHWLRDIRRIVMKVERDDRLLGTLVHICLRYWYAQFKVDGPPPWFYERDHESELMRVGRGHPKLIEQAKIIFAYYLDRWGDADRAWRVLSMEDEYSIRLGDVFGIYETMSIEEQTELANQYGLFGPAINIELQDLNARPSKRADLIVERSDGVQQEYDYKSTAGRWNSLPPWTRFNEYGLALQPMMYMFIGQNAVGPDGTLLFPRLSQFWIQRMLTKDPFTCDRNMVEMTPSAFSEIPYLLARQIGRRRRLREAIAGGQYPASGPLGSYHMCWRRGGACDYYAACRNDDREGTLSRQYQIEGEAR